MLLKSDLCCFSFLTYVVIILVNIVCTAVMKIHSSSSLSQKDINKSFFCESVSYLMLNTSDKSQIGKMSGKGVLPSQVASGGFFFVFGFGFFCQLLKAKNTFKMEIRKLHGMW